MTWLLHGCDEDLGKDVPLRKSSIEGVVAPVRKRSVHGFTPLPGFNHLQHKTFLPVSSVRLSMLFMDWRSSKVWQKHVMMPSWTQWLFYAAPVVQTRRNQQRGDADASAWGCAAKSLASVSAETSQTGTSVRMHLTDVYSETCSVACACAFCGNESDFRL